MPSGRSQSTTTMVGGGSGFGACFACLDRDLLWYASRGGVGTTCASILQALLQFPHLSGVARQYLGIAAMSAFAERLFSIAGRVFRLTICAWGHGASVLLEERMWAKINSEHRKKK